MRGNIHQPFAVADSFTTMKISLGQFWQPVRLIVPVL